MTTPLTYTITEAAERIGAAVTVDWLRKHIDEIPHTKSGRGTGRAGRIAFTEAHLAEIVLLIERRPESLPAPGGPADDDDDWGIRSRRQSANEPSTRVTTSP